MNTQRDNDIAQLEAKLKSEKLFQEWRKSYLGKRAQYGNRPGRGDGIAAEDRQSPESGYPTSEPQPTVLQ